MKDELLTPHIWRRKYFIFRSFQGKLLLGIWGTALISLALLAIHYHAFSAKIVNSQAWGMELVWLFLIQQRPLLIQLGLFVLVLCGVTLAVSHRVAGPLFRLEKSIRVVQDGNLVHRVQFRKGDELPHLRDAFNGMLDSLHARVRKDRHTAEQLVESVEALLAQEPAGSERRKILEHLKIHLTRITRGFTL